MDIPNGEQGTQGVVRVRKRAGTAFLHPQIGDHIYRLDGKYYNFVAIAPYNKGKIPEKYSIYRFSGNN
jgi:hypothetical protein